MRKLLVALALAPCAAAAIGPDLKVSTDDLNEAGERFIEVQASKVGFLGELSYGITDHWQLAAKLPFARGDGVRALGAVAELRYLAPHDRAAGSYWGVDLSAGREREGAGEPYVSAVSAQPVLGYRTRAWHLAANPSLTLPSSGPERSATFALQAKAGRRIGGHEVGLELFRHADRTRHLFLAWDKVHGTELSVALGRGLTEASGRWILKAACSFPLR